MAMDRERRLTPAGTDMYMDKCQRYTRQLSLIHNEIDTLVRTVKENPGISDIETYYEQLNQTCIEFEGLSNSYVDFLAKTRTMESEYEKCQHLQYRDNVKMYVAQVLAQRTHNDKTQSSTGRRSTRSGSSRSTTKSMIIQKKAKLEAAKSKLKYVEKQSEILQKKVALEAELNLIQIKQETDALESALKVMEMESELQDRDTESVSSTRRQRTDEFVQNHFVNKTDSASVTTTTTQYSPNLHNQSISKTTEDSTIKHLRNDPVTDTTAKDTDQHSGVHPPISATNQSVSSAIATHTQSNNKIVSSNISAHAQSNNQVVSSNISTHVQSTNQLVSSAISTQAQSNNPFVTSTWCPPMQSYNQFVPQPTQTYSHPRLMNVNNQHTVQQPIPTMVHSSPLSSNILGSHVYNLSSSNAMPQQSFTVPNMVSVGTPFTSQYGLLNPPAYGFNSQVELCQLMTKMMARKDVVLSRLIKYNESPLQYMSWKQTFKDVMSELSVTPSEELDLMIKWLGPESSRQVECMKRASAGNYVDALVEVWGRLDFRYGNPELLEACLKNKITNFPKLSNTASDSKRLYDLYDILCEIQSVKANPYYSSVLALYDSSSGVNQIVSLLPTNLQEKWSSRANTYKIQNGVLYPPFSFFVNFIHEMAKWRTDPSFQFNTSTATAKHAMHSQPPIRVSVRKSEVSANSASENQLTCPIHNTNHNLNQCRAFRKKPMKERIELLKKHKLCFRCCSLKRHTQNKCRETVRCDICKRSDHPTALHVSSDQESHRNSYDKGVNFSGGNKQHGGEPQIEIDAKCTQVCGDVNSFSKSCAKILQVYIYNEAKPEYTRKVYALIDDQSNCTLGTSELFDCFKDNSEHIGFTLSTCSGKVATTGRKGRNYVVEAIDHTVKIPIPAIVECEDIPNNRHEIPSPQVVEHFSHLSDLSSCIPPVEDDVHIELLIGRDITQAHHILDQRVGGDSLPFAHKLPLGWVVIGECCLGGIHHTDIVYAKKTYILPNGRSTHMLPCNNNKLDVKQDSVFHKTPYDERLVPSVEDRLFVDLMESNVLKGKDNHWTAPLPFRKNRQTLPNNRTQAVQRVVSLGRSLQRDDIKKKHVLEFMQKMLVNGHAELAPPLQIGSECWYLPIFGVYHPKKPEKVRVVFDSSARFGGTSLNDVLMKGPDLTNSLLGVLLRFRQEAVAMTADVEQMFYNFKVDERHRDYLRFVWHDSNDISRPLRDFRMTVHVFGNSPSPSVATFCLRKSVENADEDIRDFVGRDFYVDDGLKSCADVDSAVDLMKRTQRALEVGGGLRLHKIVSNSKSVLQCFPPEDLSSELKDLDIRSKIPPIQRSLGLSWDISEDRFVFKVSQEYKPFTRRGALSVINSLFDPIGFASPVTMYGKLLLREMMTVSGPINWDEALPAELKCKWEQWVSSLVHLRDLYIPRKYSDISYCGASRKEVHIFSDASKDAIASVAYLKLITEDRCDVSFLLGKSKVSPVHGHTIPRLELCAAVLSIEVADLVKEHMDISSSDFYFYTDSKVVLGYLSNDVRRFYVYVTNRVNRIRAATSPTQWSFVPTKQNPADIATRRINSADLAKSVYLTGPEFLRNDTKLETFDYPLMNPNDDKEVRREITVHKTVVSNEITWSLRFERFSTWNSLVSAIMFLKCRIRKLHNESMPTRLEAEQLIVRVVQQEVYTDELQAIETCRNLSSNSNIIPLAPILDRNGILRVGGRLKHAKTISVNLQPIIIPKKHHIANLLVRHYHNVVHHQGRHITEGALRSSGYWIIGSKRLVSSIISRCVTCRKSRGKFKTQQMSDLPEDRIHPGPPFTIVGLDTFGPFYVIHRKTRGVTAQQKRWTILFTCLVSRAVHLEVVDEMSSASFINAFRRFVAIRGPVKLLRSDRGTNFVGAVQELGMEADFVENDTVSKTLASYGTTWKFNSPQSSHFGGSWERMIGVCRRILDDMLIKEKNKLTHDSLVTLMAEVSAIVNSRPLLPVSTDPENPEVLSPSVLLTHKKGQNDICSLSRFGTKDMIRYQWKLVQGLADEFWSRWTKEYISALQVRRKWNNSEPNLRVGDVVLVREKESHRSAWPMAVVIRLFPSSDSLVRKVEIRLFRENKSSTLVRPVVELVPLILMDDN